MHLYSGRLTSRRTNITCETKNFYLFMFIPIGYNYKYTIQQGGKYMNKKTLVVGGVAGGATTCARLRRLDEKAEIIMFERGEYISINGYYFVKNSYINVKSRLKTFWCL